MGLFGKINEAKYSEGGIYILPGVYRLRVDTVKAIRTRTAKDAFVVEVTIMESTNKDRLPGSACTWMVTLDKEPALGNIKQFISVAAPCEMDQVTEAVAEAVTVEKGENAQPLKGRIVRCSAVEIMTKANRPFTKVKFIADSVGAAEAEKIHAENRLTA